MHAIHDVFISHAGEDKDFLAQPIYEYLRKLGILGFLDREELKPGGDAQEEMIRAMETAPIGIFILCPEFAMKKWTMKELFCFHRRRAQAAGSSDERANIVPVLIPVFYRLTVAESRYRQVFNKYAEVAAQLRFFDRADKNETNITEVLDGLAKLTDYTGIENVKGVTNDSTEEMKAGREELVKKVCTEVGRVMTRMFPVTCNVPENSIEVTLDFEGAGSAAGGSHELRLLQEIVREEEGGERRIIGVKGGAGVGKSCLLRGVGRRKELNFRFRGGVYYVSLGMDATVETLIAELLTILRACGRGEEAKELKDERRLERVLEKVRDALKGKKSLILIDDLWQRNGLGPRTVEQVCQVLERDSGGVVVVTTRDTAVAVKGRVVEVAPRGVLSAESKRILLRHAKLSVEEIAKAFEGVLDELLKLCGGLPLCLAVMGRGFAELTADAECMTLEVWERYLEMMREGERLVFGAVDGYKDVWTTMHVALRLLEERRGVYQGSGRGLSWYEMHRSLCTMKKQSVVSFRVLARAWALESEGEALHVVKSFSGVGLADVVIGGEGRTNGIRLHDLTHDFCVACAKKEREVSEWHRRILEGYIREEERVCGLREWWNVEDDGYIYDNACRHLWRSGNVEELIELLLKRGWTEARFEHGGLISWIGDFVECEEGISASGKYAGEEEDELKKGLELVRDCVIESWTFIASNRRELGFQVDGRLGECREVVVRKFVGSTREGEEKPHAKALGRWWDLPGGRRRGGDFALSDAVWDVAIHEERGMVVAGVGRDVVFIDMERMEVERTCTGHVRTVGSVGFSSDGVRALSWSCDGVVREWDVESGEEVGCVTLKNDRESEDGANKFFSASICAQRNVVATGSYGGRVEAWDIESGERIGEATEGFDGWVFSMSVSRDGSRIVAAGRDGAVLVWDLLTCPQVGFVLIWQERGTAAYCVACSVDGRLVASGSDDGRIRVWEVESGTQRGGAFRRHELMVLCLSFSEDDMRIVSGGQDNTVRIWDAVTGAQVGRSLRGHVGSVWCVSMSRHAQLVVSGGDDETVQVWDLATISDDAEEQSEDLSDTEEQFEDLSDTEEQFEDLSDAEEQSEDLRECVYCLGVSADGRWFVSGSSDGTVRIYDGWSGKQVGDALYAHDTIVSCVAVNPCGGRFVSGSWDKTLCVWDIETREQVGEPLRGHTDYVNCVAYSPNGLFIVSGSRDKTVRVWSSATHAPIGGPIGGGAEAMAGRMPLLLKGIRRLFGYAEEREAYDEESGDGHVITHSHQVSCVSVSADEGQVICGFSNGILLVWDLSSRKPIGALRSAHNDGVVRLDVLAGNMVRSVACDGVELSWRLDHEEGLVQLTGGIDGRDEGAEGTLSEGRSEQIEVVCVWRDVRVRGSVKLATLPAHVNFMQQWCFNVASGVLGVVLEDDRLLFLKVEQ